LNFTRVDWLYAGSAAGALGVAALALFFWRNRWRRDPEEVERRRRQFIGRVGRIAHAEILEVVETEAEASRKQPRSLFQFRAAAPAPPSRRLLVVYRYAISGVTYETAQDLTGLATGLMSSAAGQSASVKYDPAHPSNSILAAENWSGLRDHRPDAATPRKGK
jgi:hypothetical protein